MYKKYELSLSLNGDLVMHIARNSAGVVVFRQNTEKELKKAIDNYIKEQQYLDELAEQKRLEKEAKKGKAEVILTKDVEVIEEPIVPTVVNEVVEPTSKRVTRGPDGKFISKSQLDPEEKEKKTFWDKLTS
ncbi:MAG: hypothetical protein UR39_C0011G0029 [Candidatus Woesebacteria bacterium GW2011_GWA1_33_30]|uniref:Uncharacterized protein n=1 Tax=Candidatus Woesebacteria bacterium GW2011_GWA2_33_28 TaxID=1618561 RepID=A0A0G0CSU3_9BACT|nr:MAG: hypothetical protein UR38_C0011G0027 [Candidatus Woesebacteria bacterium GW2011_GWA2_33_28]KKP47077.1 MAG: hypothetical protein UR39_C0011G0029 [Candidatus Woesebacteria bacterium GW2011_GWA1_33_30]KKP48691.1 MAG: hypothetical protein UR40_C0012G0027 [Microgenomates group bacterium GW2011_GWC1_33_32]KKP51400.1 MAG: hypothetical protein UR44_C0011G0027 [Candidatus Woesebacteria bacterium GW2011_GWB1_33_38]KKP57439.1 MAG: hypothetical protein UR48_C0017G0012 [Microgenomates group bacteriu